MLRLLEREVIISRVAAITITATLTSDDLIKYVPTALNYHLTNSLIQSPYFAYLISVVYSILFSMSSSKKVSTKRRTKEEYLRIFM